MQNCARNCAQTLISTVMLTLQSLLSSTLWCERTHTHCSYLVHHLGVSMELSTTLTLAMFLLATSHHTGCHPLSSRQCVIKLMTCHDKISFNPQSLLGVLQPYLYAARIYTVNHNPPDLWSIIVRLIKSLRVMAFPFLKSSISWTGLAEAKHLPN